ncbi:hypothetical protein RB195_010273 [Necator americanus]|uniref:EF-hand domain-containing protein n=1 Tax=Necator americanus TaxID=51031 RepID=A0ABR1CYF9_NECAM
MEHKVPKKKLKKKNAKLSNAKELALKYHVSKDDVEKIYKIFVSMDDDGSGTITAGEVAEMLCGFGCDVSPKVVQAVMRSSDKSGDGEIDFEEFLTAVTSKIKLNDCKADIHAMFEKFDRDKDGLLSAEELVVAWSETLKTRITIKEAAALIQQETRMRDQPVINIKITPYTAAMLMRTKCAFLRLRDRRGRKLWTISAHAPTETAEDNSKDAFYELEQQSDVLGKWYYPAECTSDNGDCLVDLCEQTSLIIASKFKRNLRRHQLTWEGSTLLTPEEQRKRKMKSLKLQLDYVLAWNIPQSDIRKSRAVAGKKFAFASAETKSTYNSVCVARSTGDFNQEKRPRRKLRCQLQQDRDNEWASTAMEFEKAWEDKNPRKTYALLKQCSGKMKRCSPVLNTANGVAVGEATLPIWREYFKILLNRHGPSAPELEHVHRSTYAFNEEPPTESEVLVCI